MGIYEYLAMLATQFSNKILFNSDINITPGVFIGVSYGLKAPYFSVSVASCHLQAVRIFRLFFLEFMIQFTYIKYFFSIVSFRAFLAANFWPLFLKVIWLASIKLHSG